MNQGTSIHITGIVQGVGFRPWVWKTATRLGLTGSVRNDFDGVRIELFGDADRFMEALRDDPPPLAQIDTMEVASIAFRPQEDFSILDSETNGKPLLRISPDISICDDCRHELFDPSNRRYRYPFINCVNCGPRFSIIERLPYDRPNTCMRAFDMCPACLAEYTDPSNRRHHAQPIACPECGPKIWSCSAGTQSQPVRTGTTSWEVVWREAMEQGKIVAVKGVGGFHLACDAFNSAAVDQLRQRKERESKPFALMAPNLEWVRNVCDLSPMEEKLLNARERPIVLLRLKNCFPTAELIAPGLNTLGVMLPYSPIHEIMFNVFPHPVVMTSANYASEPMIHTNEVALGKLQGIADVFLMHDRDIINRCDDPVCAVFGKQTIVIRPGRGVAPVSMPAEVDDCILACGADMKNAFALAHDGHITLHPYVGDLEHPESQAILEQAIHRELECFHQKPALVVHDLHPDYFSTRMARHLADRFKVSAVAVQHHHAHLVGTHPGKAIGFAFDGTGYGTDGMIWGGEIMLYDTDTFSREFHLRPFALPGGDAAVKAPERVIDSLLYQTCKTKMEASSVATQIKSGINCPMTSSMGRLFDAVSCLLGVCRNPTYDGEAAIRLEAMADPDECGDLEFTIAGGEIDWRPMILDLLDGLEQEIPASVLSARFHNTVAEIVYWCGNQLAEVHGKLPWVFAGGVFQNRLLVERIRTVAGDKFELFFSGYPNDSGIAIGQSLIGAKQWASR